ncbi:hypothetical protein APW19_12395 [Staphylococcus aureus]|uniref:hypothetical protein n=1 Tax=Staphylococcus TaxID=1279 RepID=UPI000BA7B41B|nr:MULTISPECIES: hypothetical protein [Staphylococcus]MBM9733130.1 hypothetical protein [Staphylococcus aureus]MCE5132230.1 hypothetical protein [Staphylococcus saprophyticus]MDK7754176.1 hypothetical protein [Staphylococcus sp. UMB10092B]PAH02432.1 hypothetical protein APV84_13370 [Staphylococcus aureus]PAH55784.1 hypothetical protein APW04_12460 [Staphylococcus aureus]
MNNVKVNLLKFLAHYDYLDFDSHDVKDGTPELTNNVYENDLYHELFNQLIEPKIREFREKGHPEEEIVFNFFCRSDNPERILLSFYKPDVDYEVIPDVDGTPVLVNTLLLLNNR